MKQGLTTQTPPGCTLSRAPRARLCRGLVVVCATALAAIVPSGPAAAQIAVDQLEMVFQTRAGNPRLGIINLRNEGDRAVQAVVKLEDWDRAEDGTNRWYPVGTVPGSCGKALEIFPPTVSLDPGASQAVRVTFDSTAAITGECWMAAVIETVAPRTDGDRGIRNVIRTATKIYVQAEGLTSAGEVVALRPAMMLLKDRPDSVVALEVGFANTGQRHLVAKGEIQIRRGDNTIAASIPVPALYALPGANARTKVPLPTLASGRYVVLAILDYGGDELGRGSDRIRGAVMNTRMLLSERAAPRRLRRSAVGQSLSSAAPTKAVPPPTLAQYDAAPPNNVSGSTGDVGGTGNIVLTSQCVNPNNAATACRLKIVGLGAGQPLALEWMLVSAGTGGSCSAETGVTIGAWNPIVAGQTIQRTQWAPTAVRSPSRFA